MKNGMMFLILILACSLSGCGSVVPGGSGDLEYLLDTAEKNINKAGAVEEIAVRERLLGEALAKLRKAEDQGKGKKIYPPRFYTAFALYYYSRGEYVQARNYIDLARKADPDNAYASVLDCRLKLREKGASYAPEAIRILERAEKGSPGLLLTQLTFGDCHFLSGDYPKAREYYIRVLKANREYQVAAADRLETIYQIESSRMNPRQIREIIFSPGVKRDEIAYLLDKEFRIDRMLRGGRETNVAFKDLKTSSYADSIEKVRSLGMFSHVTGDTFSPFSLVTRAEMARIIEDFIVLGTNNIGYRGKYKKGEKSPIRDVKSDDPWYNAVRIAVDKNIMDLTLGGSFNPLEPLRGLDAVIMLNAMMRNYNR